MTIYYHGAQKWNPPPQLVPARSQKTAEHGPGFYLSSGIETARKYAKGGGIVLRFQIAPELHLLKDAKISAEEAVRFLDTLPRLRYREAIQTDLRNAAIRTKSDLIPANMLNNFMLNRGVAYGEPGLALARFYRDRGIDGDMVRGMGLAGNEDWLLLYNLDKIQGWERVVPSRSRK